MLLPVDTTGPDLTTDPAGTRLLPTPARAFAPAWAPDGSALAIWIADDGSDTRDRDLWHLNVATGALRPLSQGVAQSVAAVRPSWHPLGTLLAFVAEEPGRPGAPTAWLVGADGSGQRRLLRDDGSSHHEWVQWAPHGLALALESNLNADGALIVTPAGAVLHRLGAGSLERVTAPVWSPDGTHLFAVADERGGGHKPELLALTPFGDLPLRQLTTDSSVFPTTLTAVHPGLAHRAFAPTRAGTAAEVA